jgi:hypothetical protein
MTNTKCEESNLMNNLNFLGIQNQMLHWAMATRISESYIQCYDVNV